MVCFSIDDNYRPMPVATPFDDLDREQMRELLLRLRLYAQWKVRAASHRDPELDPQDLALKAIADTLDGTRNWNRERFELLKHLTNCIDSYVGHRYASAVTRRTSATVESTDVAAQLVSEEPGPAQRLSADRDVMALHMWIAEHHPRLLDLLRLVVDEGMSLADRRDVALGLGLDPDESAQMQRAYRQITALKSAVSEWRALHDGASA
jgi:hypothetical protein